MSPKSFRKLSSLELELFLYLSNISKEVSQLTDIQEIQNHLELVYQSPKNVSKKCHQELELSLHLYNFSQKVSQLTHWQTYKRFRIIWNKCTKITGMPPKNLREIYPTELEISLYEPNFNKDVSQLSDWETYKKVGIIWKKSRNILGMSLKISERYVIQNWRYPYICLILARK